MIIKSKVEDHDYGIPENVPEYSQGPQEILPPDIKPPATAILDPPVTTRSGRITGPPAHLQDFVVYEATTNLNTIVPEIDTMSPLAFNASSDPDVLYYHEAMAAHDREQFR
jgi:hypothetical protein